MSTTNAPPGEPAEVAEVYSEDGYYAVIPEWVLDADISALAVRLYAVLRRYADQRTMHAHPSRKTLAARLRVKSIRTVDGAIDELKGIGALRTFGRKTAAGDQDSNGYVLHRVPKFDTSEARPAVPAAPFGGGAADCTTPGSGAGGGAADCTTPGAADRTTLVQPAAHEPQPPNHSQINHRGAVEEEPHQREGEREQPPSIPSTPDGVHRTCLQHRVTPATGPCPPCGDWRRAVEVAQAQLATEAAARAAQERRVNREAAELAAAERSGCGLCDAEGTALVYLHGDETTETVTTKCLHDVGRNERSVQIRRAARAALAARPRQVG